MTAIPKTMQAIAITEPGPPEVLKPVTIATPEPSPGEVLIKVAAAGVNRPDCIQRAGHYPPPPGAPETPGLEVAGEVVAAGGSAAGDWQPGARVCALVAGGGYAEYCVAPAAQCLPVPGALAMTEAAALPETFFTVWSNVFDRAALAQGETLLVHGGASGIGTTAIQLARAFGAGVIVTCGSAAKQQACEALGAVKAINYREEDFVEAVKEATGQRGVDVVLDMVGGDYLPRNIAVMAPDGRLVQIAFLGGSKVSFDFGPVMRNRLTLTGSTLRPRPVAFKAAIAERLRERVWPLLERGEVRPVMYRSLPLAEAASAHALMESNAIIGKVVLETGAGP